MAFIREYSMAGDPRAFVRLRRTLGQRIRAARWRALGMAGDPGFGSWLKRAFKPPKAIRKLQPFKALGKVAGAAAGFIPGIGGIAQQLLAPAAAPEPMPMPVYAPPEEEEEEEEEDPREAFMRMLMRYYGLESGDPGAKGKAPKRKSAAAGPKAKAKKKKAARKAKVSAAAGPKATERIMGALGTGLKALPAIGGFVEGSGIFGGTAAERAAARAMGFGGKRRRSMNPANVRALRRSLRRVDSFTKLAKKSLGHLGYRIVRQRPCATAHFGKKRRAA